MINHDLLQVAQGEIAIAIYLGDGKLWERAKAKMRVAMGTPRYKRGGYHVYESVLVGANCLPGNHDRCVSGW